MGQNLAGHMEASSTLHNIRTEQLVPEAAPHLAAPRMDICATDSTGAALHVDLTVASPITCSAMRAGSSYKPGVAADILARHKINKYGLAQLIPFAIETFGRMSDNACGLLCTTAPCFDNRFDFHPADDSGS